MPDGGSSCRRGRTGDSGTQDPGAAVVLLLGTTPCRRDGGTDPIVYLSLQGVGGGTHLKDEYGLPVGHNVYLKMDPLSSAGKTLTEAERVINV
ncbi:hypothetical protein [Arthrobacter sp. H16F315]|uniref:hypothetical protein n=1 Tax=Arthrobacter sp. H16F315 TaxID=2955314 RepID=UPI0020978E5A|nr:hypothetical protein [Arthrobacter sp. H16F315]MDD1475491.1 hypothetical protein [Arthrobacter sp. H16F315]